MTITMDRAELQVPHKLEVLKFNRFALNDQKLISTHVETFKPLSCEYNFSNLFAWQYACKLFWTIYHDRILIYDGVSKCAFMPLGEDLCPKELMILSLKLKYMGLSPDFSLVSSEYIKKYSDLEKYYIVKKERDNSEYIYDVEALCELKGIKLHKKRNLISQFKRTYSDFEVHELKDKYRYKALELAQNLIKQRKYPSITIDHEFSAIKISFDNFDELGLHGLAITVGSRLVAFCVFSRLCPLTYDIQFEKFDANFKGAAQVINHETAKYLRKKCQYLNREQDLGIAGLRQAKMSYDPVNLITPYSLVFTL